MITLKRTLRIAFAYKVLKLTLVINKNLSTEDSAVFLVMWASFQCAMCICRCYMHLTRDKCSMEAGKPVKKQSAAVELQMVIWLLEYFYNSILFVIRTSIISKLCENLCCCM